MILVFKTTVDSPAEISFLKPYLDKIDAIQKWNFDLWDCDKILRIDGPAEVSSTVIHTLNRYGFHCVELE